MIFETHTHYDDEVFAEDRERLLASLPGKGVGRVLSVGCSIGSTKEALKLAGEYDHLYAAVGVHPSDIGDLDEEALSWLLEQTKMPKVVAVGEIGLDYYWDKDTEVQKRQRKWFCRQLELAQEAGLPVIIHSRDAAWDTVQILKEAGGWDIAQRTSEASGGGAHGVIHCYSYSPALAQEFVKMGYYIGVGGVVTFKNAKKLKETVQEIPLERILLETDCPYMAPEPHRGERNDSTYLSYVVSKIAELKGVTVGEVERVTWENAMNLFPKAQ